MAFWRTPRNKRIIGIFAMLAAFGLVYRENYLRKHHHLETTLVFDFGTHASEVREIDVDVWRGDDAVGTFHRRAGTKAVIGDARFKAKLPDPDVALTIQVKLDNGAWRGRKSIHGVDGDVQTISLGSDLDHAIAVPPVTEPASTPPSGTNPSP